MRRYNSRMTYRLNLYCNAKLTSTELVDASLAEAKGVACTALTATKFGPWARAAWPVLADAVLASA